MVLRFKAFEYEEAPRLQPLQFLQPVWQLLADIFIFGITFNIW